MSVSVSVSVCVSCLCLCCCRTTQTQPQNTAASAAVACSLLPPCCGVGWRCVRGDAVSVLAACSACVSRPAKVRVACALPARGTARSLLPLPPPLPPPHTHTPTHPHTHTRTHPHTCARQAHPCTRSAHCRSTLTQSSTSRKPSTPSPCWHPACGSSPCSATRAAPRSCTGPHPPPTAPTASASVRSANKQWYKPERGCLLVFLV